MYFDLNLVHPQYKSKETIGSTELHMQRKKNMLILENLFIRQNDNATKSVYGDRG